MIRENAAAIVAPLLTHVWESTLFLVVVLLIGAVLRNRLTASARFSLAFLGIVKFALPAALFTPLVKLLMPARQAMQLPIALRAIDGAIRMAPPAAAVPSIWPAVLIGSWAGLALIFIALSTIARRRLIAIAIRTAVAAEPREAAALVRAARRVGVRRSVDLARSSLREAPAVLRVVRPLLVLPPDGCGDLSDDELESLFCHEMAHVARHDNLVARFESWICALFWFHPLIWIARQITVIERERACDEVVAAASADERKTYLAALAKFCHASIAPRLPGVSCMATANLKERIDHVMNYPSIQSHAASPRRVTAAAAVAMLAFTAGAAFIGAGRANASTSTQNAPYAVRISATRSEASGSTLIEAAVTDNATQKKIASPTATIASGKNATFGATVDGLDLQFYARSEEDQAIMVAFTITKDGRLLQDQKVTLIPNVETSASTGNYQGAPITLRLKDANLRDLMRTFSQLTGLDIRVDEGIEATVSVNWVNVRWDQALDELVKENGLTWRLDKNVMYISRR
jgi:beta-lactamase regulating signal transducer with metallopeptidase domain